MRFPKAVAALVAATALMGHGPPADGAIEISPVRVDLAPGGTAAVTLRNAGSVPVSVQADVFDWSQDEAGEDRLEPTGTVVVVPPIFTLEAGARQVVRVAHLGAGTDTEQSFRLIFSELPPAQPEAPFVGVAVRLKLSIPVFVAGADRPAPGLGVTGFRESDGRGVLSVTNPGRAHAKVVGVTLHRADEAPVDVPVVRYLLPGASRDLRFDIPAGGRVQAVTVNLAGSAPVEHEVR